MKVAVILNSGAGSSGEDELPRKIRSLFQERGAEVTVLVGHSGEEILAHAKDASAQNFDVIVAGGGDGTVNAVAQHVMKSKARFGVLPLGTLNHFSKDLGIPLKIEEAVDTIVHGRAGRVDVASVNDHMFLNNSGIGLYPKIVEEREKEQMRGAKKWSAFFRALLRMFARHPYVDVKIAADGDTKEIARRSTMIFVGNNQYEIDGPEIGSRKRLDGGTLCLFVTKHTNRLSLLWMPIKALLGVLSTSSDFDTLTAREFEIESHKRELQVSLDGEVMRLTTPLKYNIHPRSLTVMCPSEKR